jgi:hypothetical protein
VRRLHRVPRAPPCSDTAAVLASPSDGTERGKSEAKESERESERRREREAERARTAFGECSAEIHSRILAAFASAAPEHCSD